MPGFHPSSLSMSKKKKGQPEKKKKKNRAVKRKMPPSKLPPSRVLTSKCLCEMSLEPTKDMIREMRKWKAKWTQDGWFPEEEVAIDGAGDNERITIALLIMSLSHLLGAAPFAVSPLDNQISGPGLRQKPIKLLQRYGLVPEWSEEEEEEEDEEEEAGGEEEEEEEENALPTNLPLPAVESALKRKRTDSGAFATEKDKRIDGAE